MVEQLHWLPLTYRIQFTVLILVFNCIAFSFIGNNIVVRTLQFACEWYYGRLIKIELCLAPKYLSDLILRCTDVSSPDDSSRTIRPFIVKNLFRFLLEAGFMK